MQKNKTCSRANSAYLRGTKRHHKEPIFFFHLPLHKINLLIWVDSLPSQLTGNKDPSRVPPSLVAYHGDCFQAGLDLSSGSVTWSTTQCKRSSILHNEEISSGDFLTSIGNSSLRTLTPHYYLQIAKSKRQKENHPAYKYHKSNDKKLMILSMPNYQFLNT